MGAHWARFGASANKVQRLGKHVGDKPSFALLRIDKVLGFRIATVDRFLMNLRERLSYSGGHFLTLSTQKHDRTLL